MQQERDILSEFASLYEETLAEIRRKDRASLWLLLCLLITPGLSLITLYPSLPLTVKFIILSLVLLIGALIVYRLVKYPIYGYTKEEEERSNTRVNKRLTLSCKKEIYSGPLNTGFILIMVNGELRPEHY